MLQSLRLSHPTLDFFQLSPHPEKRKPWLTTFFSQVEGSVEKHLHLRVCFLQPDVYPATNGGSCRMSSVPSRPPSTPPSPTPTHPAFHAGTHSPAFPPSHPPPPPFSACPTSAPPAQHTNNNLRTHTHTPFVFIHTPTLTHTHTTPSGRMLSITSRPSCHQARTCLDPSSTSTCSTTSTGGWVGGVTLLESEKKCDKGLLV